MLFLITWTEKFTSEADQHRGLQLLSAWEPPEGAEFKGWYTRADGGGFGIVEVDSAATLLKATAPWQVYLDFDVAPIVETSEAASIFGETVAWLDSVG